MSSKRSIELEHEVAILKVKLEQIEKRFNLLEKTIEFMDRSQRAVMENLQNTHFHTDSDTSSVSSSENDSVVDVEVPTQNDKNKNSHIYRSIA